MDHVCHARGGVKGGAMALVPGQFTWGPWPAQKGGFARFAPPSQIPTQLDLRCNVYVDASDILHRISFCIFLAHRNPSRFRNGQTRRFHRKKPDIVNPNIQKDICSHRQRLRRRFSCRLTRMALRGRSAGARGGRADWRAGSLAGWQAGWRLLTRRGGRSRTGQ